MSLTNPVKTLNAEVARKIAAGEVIDRPNAIVRELMDNAIDSGATSITVEIAGGGIDRIRIIDNGCGMTKEDLQTCARPHATSKIATETDLMNLTTLGFRGEALASIAAVSRLSIQSGGWKMRASVTEDHIIEPVAETQGTIVQSEGLFENFPARRVFLKRPATEGVMCKGTFIEKALARPDIAFRLIIDGQTKMDLPGNQSQKERFISANSYTEDPALFYTVSNKSQQLTEGKPLWSFNVIIGEPAVSRSSKKEIVVYVNGRKIQEYSLVQAIEYGGQGYFPNGTYPVAAAFITVDPKSVDFNIHPAKKEARFYDISDLHHGLSSTIKHFFQQYTQANFAEDKPADSSPMYERHISYKPAQTQAAISGSNFSDFRSKYMAGTHTTSSAQKPSFSTGTTTFGTTKNTFQPPSTMAYSNTATSTEDLVQQALFAQEYQDQEKSFEQALVQKESEVRFIGSCLGTFLLAEKNRNLFIIDQHAVHERILFDRLMNTQEKAGTQPLLIPYKINTESKTQDNQLNKLKERLANIGFTLTNPKDGYWEVTEVPERWTGTEYDLRTLLFVKHVEPEEIIRSIAAMTACKAAIKDGYVIDDDTAAKLVKQAFTLEDPHCPHGRPVYTVISREQLFTLVKRTF